MRFLLRLCAGALGAALLGALVVWGATCASADQVVARAGWSGPIEVPPLSELRFTSSFGRRGLSVHAGVDLRARQGTPVYAVDDGVVARADESRRAGKRVVVALDSGWRAGYAHLSRVDVVKRERVAAGQRIGLSGATGHATGPHLHFELRAPDGRLVDPRPWLRAGQRAIKRWT